MENPLAPPLPPPTAPAGASASKSKQPQEAGVAPDEDGDPGIAGLVSHNNHASMIATSRSGPPGQSQQKKAKTQARLMETLLGHCK